MAKRVYPMAGNWADDTRADDYDFEDEDVSDELVNDYAGGGERLPVANKSQGEVFCYSCGAGHLKRIGENTRGEVVLKCWSCGELQSKSSKRRGN